MEKRSLFQMIFGNRTQSQNKYQQLQLLNGTQAIWTNPCSNVYDNAQVRACIDAIARNGAKLNPKHLRNYVDEQGKYRIEKIYGRVQRLISKKPNETMNAYDFYYKVISTLELDNNAFIYIQRDEQNIPTGLYPIRSGSYQLLEYNNKVFIQFRFSSGRQYTASLQDDVIHLKKFYCENDVLGGNNIPITKVMSIKHIVDEGIINAIKTTQGIKGILKLTKAMLKPEDIKKYRDNFVSDFINSGDGIASIDATSDFQAVNINPQTATDGQVSRIDDEVLNYFGINKNIMQSNYTEDQWNAFYESVIEPIALAMSLEFTNKLFSYGERWHGNEIVFEANRLQYASTNSKINVLKEAGALGILTINECREILNLAPVEDGDQRVQSLNYTDKNNDDRGVNNNE